MKPNNWTLVFLAWTWHVTAWFQPKGQTDLRDGFQGPILKGIKLMKPGKCVVILRDIFLVVAWFGLVSYNDPLVFIAAQT